MQRRAGRRLAHGYKLYTSHTQVAREGPIARQFLWKKTLSTHEFPNEDQHGLPREEAPEGGAPLRPIRERLRSFVPKAAAVAQAEAQRRIRDIAAPGSISNSKASFGSSEMTDMLVFDGAGDGGEIGAGPGDGGNGIGDDAGDADGLGGESTEDLRGSSTDDANIMTMPGRPYGAVAARAGDLLEITTDLSVNILAVCLGSFRGLNHYYTINGRWLASSSVRSLFSVSGFATPAEMEGVIAALPAEVKGEEKSELKGKGGPPKTGDRTETPEDSAAVEMIVNRMEELRMGPARDAGAKLIRKMNQFVADVAAIHMAHAIVLDNAFACLQEAASGISPSSTTSSPSSSSTSPPPPPFLKKPIYYLTVEQIASILLRPGHRTFYPSSGRMPQVRNQRRLQPKGKKNDVDQKDEFTPAALYAVYRAVLADELAFRPLTAHTGGGAGHTDGNMLYTRSSMFAVLAPEDVKIVHAVEHDIRLFYESPERAKLVAAGVTNVPDMTLKRSVLGRFVLRCRRLIDRSRRTRAWSPHGMVLSRSESESTAPSKAKPKSKIKEEPVSALFHQLAWQSEDLQIIRFMHLWACQQHFHRNSRLHWVGAGILRALDRYRDAEYLTVATGWTFLQEIGWVAPWDVSARYSLSFPDVPPLRQGGLQRQGVLPGPLQWPVVDADMAETAETELSQDSRDSRVSLGDESDIFAGRRHDWAALRTFCIDAKTAGDIDDGISLERTAQPDEFWVHAHVADPGSSIAPGSRLGEQAARLPQTSYLAGNFSRMFDDSAVSEQFSLGPGQRCLTFSTLVRLQEKEGTSVTILASKITPGRLGQQVCYIEPEEVSTVVAEAEAEAIDSFRGQAVSTLLQPPSQIDVPSDFVDFSVGTPPDADQLEQGQEPSYARHITLAAELQVAERAELETLAKIGTALRARRLENGSMPLYWPRPKLDVSLAGTSIVQMDKTMTSKTAETPGEGETGEETEEVLAPPLLHCEGDPYIRIYYDSDNMGLPNPGSRLVESIMRLAGETAADWCHARNIAVPFRGHPDAVGHVDELRALTRDHVYPALAAGQRPPEAAMRTMRSLAGADDVVASAVPHITMGVDRYVKVTSPLRRYADLVAHWQIEAALLEEGRVADGEGALADAAKKPGTPARPARPARPVRPAPITTSQLEREVLPLLRVRERYLRMLDNRSGRNQWMLQALVRALAMEKASAHSKASATASATAHSTSLLTGLRFTVCNVNSHSGILIGRLNWFDRTAIMDFTGLNGYFNEVSLGFVPFDQVRLGQVFPVALETVDVHGNKVTVRRTGDAIPADTVRV